MAWLEETEGSVLIYPGKEFICAATPDGELPVPEAVTARIRAALDSVLRAPGRLTEQGDLILDLRTEAPGLHYPVNLLLGDRTGYAYPLVTTPKSAVDAFGDGSFRAAGQDQVLATRYVLAPEENGEPANRQFYLTEGGRQIFYTRNVRDNVARAECCHTQNRTVITYETEDGLAIERSIFLLPQEEGMPSAVEAQRVRITNHGGQARTLRFVGTGVFGIAQAATIATDVVYANLVQESELLYEAGRPVCLGLHAKPADDRDKKRFVVLLAEGKPMEEFCTDQAVFLGSGTWMQPERLLHLPNEFSRKMASFFAVAVTVTAPAGGTAVIDEFVGLDDLAAKGPEDPPYEAVIRNLYRKYRDPAALDAVLFGMREQWADYTAWLRPKTGDPTFNAYVSGNLPFQVRYQTYVSRSFAWTQKSYREIGFREIQDLYASLYYLCASGQREQVKLLLSNWIRNVFRMGYANHNFTWKGKEPGMCSDDALWLVQAVYRYVRLTGDTEFLRQEFEMADSGSRPLIETLLAILTYSGKISVGKHGLPLLDVADWNDTLRLDKEVLLGPEKEARYRRQLAERGEEYGAPLENSYCESVMNACLLRIAASETAELAEMLGIWEEATSARALLDHIAERVQKFAWKGDYFARCLINDDRPYDYLGAGGDGLSLDPAVDGSYFLNSYSWAILADIASEEQIRTMLGTVNRVLRTDAGLKLCTLIDFDKLGVKTGTAFYFPGDRENCGVFKHAAMMAVVASLKAAKAVANPALAEDLRELAFWMIGKTLPYRTLENPYTIKGNPRFCTQYNNSETGENIGPMLSGTASWLTLAVYEYLGFDIRPDGIAFRPILRAGETALAYTLTLGETVLRVSVRGEDGRFRLGAESCAVLDGVPVPVDCGSGAGAPKLRIPMPEAGEHTLEIEL
ncbi:MAG: glycosyl transferase [Mogibacterium sp.]|nr:glycosyl transferase [Mogibacterium sp.]